MTFSPLVSWNICQQYKGSLFNMEDILRLL